MKNFLMSLVLFFTVTYATAQNEPPTVQREAQAQQQTDTSKMPKPKPIPHKSSKSKMIIDKKKSTTTIKRDTVSTTNH